mmetsp:Transcript_24820/g.58229  ORF Transcript_24820/g.58229 Transcript_24820/m.58229 type:complete len:942 (-) Transcript_24820:682-3507(-)
MRVSHSPQSNFVTTMTISRKTYMVSLNLLLLVIFFPILVFASSSSSVLPVRIDSLIAPSTVHESNTIGRNDNDDCHSGRDLTGFCDSKISANSTCTVGHSNFTETLNTPNFGTSMPTGILARGGDQSVSSIGDMRDDDENVDGFVNEYDADIPSILDNKEAKKRRQFLKRREIKFLNRIAEVSSFLLKRENDATLEREVPRKRQKSYTSGLQYDVSEDDDLITHQSDLTRPGRYVHIVTTAALPWMTGTAVNPLLRAAYMHERLEVINNGNPTNSSSYVTLVIPWLELPEDQRQVYNGKVFESKDEQEIYVRNWLAKSAMMPNAATHLQIVFYNARYHAELGSVFAMGDIIQELPPNELDVCVLEEPEHLNWFRAPSMESWTKRYNYVVGIVHTNYDQYATQHYTGLWTAPAIRLMSAAMVRAYCHKVIKLSAVVQDFAPEKEITMNVHGVRQEFIAEPVTEAIEQNNTATTREENGNQEKKCYAEEGNDSVSSSQTQVYFIGKLLWTKGLDLLLQYQDYYKDMVGEYFTIDIYGSGPDQHEISRAYLGRQKNSGNINASSKTVKPTLKNVDFESRLEKASKNAFVRVFKWLKRRRKKRKRKHGKESNNGDEDEEKRSKKSITVQDIYNDVLDVIESLPLKAKESFEDFPDQLKESLDQLSEDVTKVQRSVKGLPSKARKVVNQLIDELSSRAATLPLPRSLYEFRRQPIPATFPGRIDHAELMYERGNSTDPSRYKIFVNPSISEVLCTSTAEALAMGKFVIIPEHPSNTFFTKFPNCLSYRNPHEFVANLRWALTHDPVPHTHELAREFTWEAATDRFLEASAITHKEARERELLGRSKIDERIAWLHNELGKGVRGDIIRKALGGGPVSGQVKYEMTKQRNQTSNVTTAATVNEEKDIISDEEDIDMEDEGMPRKFRNSVFVQALREAIESSLTPGIE